MLQVSDALYNSNNDRYMSLSYALYLNPFVLIFGVGFFLYSARFVPKDEYNCKIETQGADSETSSNGNTLIGFENPQYFVEFPFDTRIL